MLKNIKRIVDKINLTLVWNAYMAKNKLLMVNCSPTRNICLCKILEKHPIRVCSN